MRFAHTGTQIRRRLRHYCLRICAPYLKVMVTNMRFFLLFTLIGLPIVSYAEKSAGVWELDLKTHEGSRSLKIELTDEKGDSCMIGNPKKVRTLEGEAPSSKYFTGYSYSISNGVLSIDMFPLLCDGGDLLRGKIEAGTIAGEILSSSIGGLEKIGTFSGKTVE